MNDGLVKKPFLVEQVYDETVPSVLSLLNYIKIMLKFKKMDIKYYLFLQKIKYSLLQ